MRERSDRDDVVGPRTVAGRVRGPLLTFLRSQSCGAALLLGACALALVWANIPAARYEAVWSTRLSVGLGSWQLSMSLRTWINSGLMALFFFVVGLEARRQADLGELREARGKVLPVLAGLAGLAAPAGIYLAFTAGSAAAHAWGTAMATDTAFALGALSVAGPRYADRVRAFLVGVLVVDDLASLIVIAVGYSTRIATTPLLITAALFAVMLAVRAAGVRTGLVYALVAVAWWVAMLESGIDPLLVGLVTGLLVPAYPAGRAGLERASAEFRRFREQPTGEYARRARVSLEAAISPNDRRAALWLPWTNGLIVPLFAVANAGVPLGVGVLHTAVTSPITLGIVAGYLIGKPVAITTVSYLVSRLSGRRLRPSVGWGAVVGAGAAAGTGFTVALLIASLALDGAQLQQAKLGLLATVLLAPVLSLVIFRLLDLLSPRRRARALLGDPIELVDLADPVDPDRDHIRGPVDAPVTLVEYGDFECRFCGRAEPAVRELLREFGDLAYVWRHLPLDDVHPHARLAAEASECAGAQGAFWRMHDLLLAHQDALDADDLVGYAARLGLDVARFTRELTGRKHAARVAHDVDGADLSRVGGTPTFFINGRRHHGAYDLDTLAAAVTAAGARAAVPR